MNEQAQVRFFEKVALPDERGCCVWTGSVGTNGYGQLKTRGRQMSAHRASYALFVGPIPDGMLIDHVCHRPTCVAPDHLRLATRKQNAENRSVGSKSSGASGVRGVYALPYGRWRVKLGHNGRSHYFGIYDTVEEAAAVAAIARRSLFTHDDGN